MAKIVPSTSRAAVLRGLGKAATKYQLTLIATDRAINPDHWLKINPDDPTSVLSRLRAAVENEENKKAAKSARIKEARALRDQVEMAVRHFHGHLDDLIEAGKVSSGPAARDYFGRSPDNPQMPTLNSQDDIVEAAGKIVSGDARRLAAEGQGALQIVQPSANDVGALRDELNDAIRAVEPASEAYDLALEATRPVLEEGIALSADITPTVEYHYRHDPDASSRRVKCARWGVVYSFAPNETPDPEEPEEPA